MQLLKRQSTLSAPVVCAGTQLHGGARTRMALRPAPIDTGLVFVRTDIEGKDNHIPVRPDAVSGVRNCTTLSNSAGVRISTVEHLMAALAASDIDNLYIDLDSDELPALDGSSAPFVELIEQVGIDIQPAPRRYIKILKPVSVHEGDSIISIEPCDHLELDVTIDFDDVAIGRQRLNIIPDARSFRDKVASARTFARAHEVDALKAAGLSKGGSLENAVIVDGDRILNPEGLRFANEFVAHKALDLMGDLYLAGPVLGRVTAVKCGHAINHAFLMALFSDPDAWCFTTLGSSEAQKEPNSISA